MTRIYRKQPLDKTVKGVTLRYNMKFNIWVNRAGTRAYREYNDPSWNRFLQIHTNIDGSKFLNVKPKPIPLDEIVADCFNPMPKDGKKYVLIHKDNDLGNCHADNLEWKQARRFSPLDTERKLDNGLVVKVNGEILEKGEKLCQENHIYDPDTEREVAIAPRVEYYRKNPWGNNEKKHAYIDELMAAAEFVDGDRASMNTPRVLHKNMDYLDFHADNLEWVEESSQEYRDYIKRKEEDMDKLTKELNQNNPNFPKD